MHRLRSHRICIVVTEEQIDFDKTLREAPLKEIIRFEGTDTRLMGIERDWKRDTVKIYICHPEFEPVWEGEECRRYSLEQAKTEFPYLFVKTNPLLYREFCPTSNIRCVWPVWRKTWPFCSVYGGRS